MVEVTQEDRDIVDHAWLSTHEKAALARHVARHRIAADLAGYERGQRETVARIVAWLRKPLTIIKGVSMDQNERLADAIEAGEWK